MANQMEHIADTPENREVTEKEYPHREIKTTDSAIDERSN